MSPVAGIFKSDEYLALVIIGKSEIVSYTVWLWIYPKSSFHTIFRFLTFCNKTWTQCKLVLINYLKGTRQVLEAVPSYQNFHLRYE